MLLLATVPSSDDGLKIEESAAHFFVDAWLPDPRVPCFALLPSESACICLHARGCLAKKRMFNPTAIENFL